MQNDNYFHLTYLFQSVSAKKLMRKIKEGGRTNFGRIKLIQLIAVRKQNVSLYKPVTFNE